MQEVSHAGGRTDIVADHPCGTYVFELKVDKPPKVERESCEWRDNKPRWCTILS